MKLSLRYVVIFESRIPTLEFITEKLKGHLEVEINSERSSLISSEYLDGVNTYIFHSVLEDIVEILIIEGELNELHIYSDNGENSLLESILLIFVREGGKVSYDSSVKNGWLKSLMNKLKQIKW